MAIGAGKNFDVLVSVDDVTYYDLGSTNDATHGITADLQDVTVFGSDWLTKMQALKDSTYSLSGFYDNADTNGQIAVRAACIADTALYVKVEYDGTNGYKQEVKVASFEFSASVDGIGEFSIELEGTGAVTAVP